MNNQVLVLAGLAAGALFFAGCESSNPQPTIKVDYTGGPRIASFQFDPRDYDEVAQRLYQSIADSRKVGQGKVVALSTVTVNLDTSTPLDATTLQERFATLVQRGNLFQFSFAGQKITRTGDDSGNEALKHAMEARRLYAMQKTIDNQEDYEIWGQLAKIDYILFCRITSQSQAAGNLREITYRLNYKLGDCRTGLWTWTDEVRFTKSGKN